jgi:hypothetical protein
VTDTWGGHGLQHTWRYIAWSRPHEDTFTRVDVSEICYVDIHVSLPVLLIIDGVAFWGEFQDYTELTPVCQGGIMMYWVRAKSVDKIIQRNY